MEAVQGLSDSVNTISACVALSVARSSFYRWRRNDGEECAAKPRPSPPRSLSSEQREEIRDLLNSEEHVDKTPAEVYGELLDRGSYLCSVRTMYRVLAGHSEVRERRDLLRHPKYEKPQLLASGPNQVWSWDLTKLHGPVKWAYYHLYVILDVFSRYVVGWMLAERESATLAKRFIEETISKYEIDAEGLTIHSDRGSAPGSKLVAQLLADLGVTKSHSRPHTPGDNPFSESQFKTMKYRPEFPKRFYSLEESKSFGRLFFRWYNEQHHHSALGQLTPATVHFGRAEKFVTARQEILDRAFARTPERFVNGPPQAARPPKAVWINAPKSVSIHRNGEGEHEVEQS